MDLILGLACDGRAYPDFPGEGSGALHAAVVGPSGLIDVLEVQLGLTGPRGAEAVRIAAYAAKLRAASTTGSAPFFADSFSRDPWATAKTLLGWRDQLVAAGWPGQPMGSARLDDLAKAEVSGPSLPPGTADRLCAVLTALTDQPAITLHRLRLVEPRELLPPPCRRLVDQLERCDVTIEQVARPGADADSDLDRVRAFLTTGTSPPLNGDASFVTVDADTALMAAEALAEWLAAGSEEELAGTVIVSCDGDTALLDRALQARGLPALGQSAASPWRGALQVLPLAFAASWAPFDAKALLDLLLLPRPPIGRSAARKLARALAREPGTGAAAWDRAWADLDADLTERFADHPQAETEISRRRDRWREWTTGGLYNRIDGIPADAARRIAGRVGQWAIETDAGASDPLLLTVAGAASALTQAIDVLGQDPLPALLVERMIEQVLAEGAQNPEHVATAGGLRCVKNPASIWGPVERLIWWDFKGPGDRVPTSPWSQAETAALTSAGCALETPSAAAARIGWGYANALHHAQTRALLIRPALSGGEETVSHPLAHQLNPLIQPAGRKIRWSAERLLEDAAHDLAGRRLPRELVAIVQPPQARARWTLPASAVAKLADRKESATSFERLADCQMRWMLLDVLRLSRGRFSEIPGPDQLLGNLAHEIANHVLQPGPVADAEAVLQQVDAVFDALLSAIASPLQQPEFAGELAAARARVPAALAELARLLRQKNLEVVGTELDREAAFANGLAVLGRLDLVVRHPAKGTGVIDLKWTRSANRRRTELAEGRALQLATYGAIADPAAAAPAPGAYYLLNQRRLIGPTGAFVADEEIEASRSLTDTWTDLVETWRAWRDLAANGVALGAGLPRAADHFPADLRVSPNEEPCRYCELTSLCRVTQEAN
ncbi:PD-(D/E)XK nuclease family protein [Brevundimonas bacteroides]|uniref:PD-(D/E)XK nuclease family protein n=1 Tax=Brevundimonas bacteroides TaxID=74311 RepID=UPI00049853EE|nr:PD-(D/E)XK nuclease family protein [Brevundimonas bacteroides]